MMKIIKIRNKIIGFLYRRVLRPIFFLQDPEFAHERMIVAGRILGSNPITRGLTSLAFNFQHPLLSQTIAGLNFKNPVGLAAGFDKEAYLPALMPCVGFGFEEAGSITALPFAGNPRPWMWRLPELQALRVNYGLKNSGAKNIHDRLAGKEFDLILGISLAKTNSKETSQVEAGIADYAASYKIFQDIGDYFTINVSCPNICETDPIFARPENLEKLLSELFKLPKTKPVFIKLSPDLSEPELTEVLTVCGRHPVDGFVCTNLTKNNVNNLEGKGGFSGKMVEEQANRTIAETYKFFNRKKIIIGCGGVFSAAGAYKKIKLGASLIQLITGMIYQGPQLVSEINFGLVKLLRRDGFKSISEAVGRENR